MSHAVSTDTGLTRVLGALIIALTLAVSVPAHGQSLDSENRIHVELDDGTKVVLYGEATVGAATKSDNYHYLPVNLRLSQNPDGAPAFLFLKYVTEESEDQGGTGGALIHFLMEWGLTTQQEQQLQRILRDQYDNAKLVGAVEMLPLDESGTFQIVSGTLSDKGLLQSQLTSGKAPLLPGGKVAVAARFDPESATMMSKTFDGSTTVADLSMVLNFAYTTQMPRANGRIIIDWNRLYDTADVLQRDYEGVNKEHAWVGSNTSHTHSEVRSHFDFLREKEIIAFQFDGAVPESHAAEVRDAFFDYYLSTFTEFASPEPAFVSAGSEREARRITSIRFGSSYQYKPVFLKRTLEKKSEFNLQSGTTVRRPFQLVANLIGWRDDVRTCAACFQSVNLNDPVFRHRAVHFVLDLDAKGIFDDVINFVVVDVRKGRPEGAVFHDSVMLDANYIATNGIAASITYADMGDKDADSYEYRVQWSLRGGMIHPPDAEWRQGSREGVTLIPPVVSRTIDLEGNLDDMRANGITRVTAQIRYRKVGREFVEHLHLSPVNNESLARRQVFVDRDAREFDYRLIVHHASAGRIALPWNTGVTDDYIYAAIPSNVLASEMALGRNNGPNGDKTTGSSGTSSLSEAQSADAATRYYDTSYALVIGIDKYPAPGWPDLNHAKKDAEGIGAFLERQGFNVIYLIDEHATKSAIIKAMQNDLARRVGAHDRILVFFAGHGHTEELAGQDWGYIVPYHKDDQSSADYISMEELQTLSKKMGVAKHQLFVMDACYGGLLMTRGLVSVDSNIPNYLQDVTRRTARLIITAGGKGQQVIDKGPDDHSVFTGHFLEALEEAQADINNDGFITFSELTGYLVPRASNAFQTPALGFLPGHGQGEFVFRVSHRR